MHRLTFHHLKLLPLTSGTVWLITLLALLIYWLAEGCPRYPGQANPYVAFISDIGAFRLQPLFMTGGIISSLTLTGTIIAVHLARRERRVSTQKPGDEQPRYEKWVSILACLFDVAACPCRICITFFDNHGHPSLHRRFLFLALAGTALSCICTAFVLWGEMWSGPAKGNELLRRSCVFSNSLLVSEVLLGSTFTGLLWTGQFKSGGFVEWVMAFVFTFYFWAFIGLLALPDEKRRDVSEETPLLH
ncbi:hypothetical protein HO173_002771 [Letharia columbiana]|uniref:CWH43-like N-terminal domain-containing protein n=1 Tax=Letharia columbiana TaxID=112416 RepID=A0A8H6G1S6_9LECA|nr:uncharacterized protein HO173_002771 [Letharia columbiana]KAF6238899.1 hypothetical protein HO173_002771 [Letharia columbiana]